jgi:hypothetical protein
MGVTSFRDGALPALLGPGVLQGNQAQELHEFLGGIEARQVAEFGHDRDRHGKLHAAQGLKGFDHGVEAPAFDMLLEFLFETVKTLGVFVDGTAVCLKDDLLSWCRTD